MIELMDDSFLDKISYVMLNKCPQCGSSFLPSPQEVCICPTCNCVGMQTEFHQAGRKLVEVN